MNKKTFRKLLMYMRGYKGLYAFGVIGFSLMLLMFQVQVALLFLQMFNALQEGEFSDILGAVVRFSILLVILIAMIPTFSYLKQKAALKTTGALRRAVFDKMTRLPIKQFRETHSAELSSIATNDLNEVDRAYADYFFMFAVQLISGIGAGIVMFFIEWRLASIIMAAGVLTLIVNNLYAKRLRSVSRKVQDRLGNLNTKFSNILAGIHVIRVFSIQRFVLSVFTKSNTVTLDASKQRVKRQSVIDACNTLIYSISFAGVTILGGYFVLEGMILLGVIVAIVQLQDSVLGLVSGLGRFIANMQTSLAAGDRIFEFLALEEEPDCYETDRFDQAIDASVAFDHVYFKYETQPVLDDVSFTVKHGETVAFVGPSGGGKSTILKVVLHLYKPEKGAIALKGSSTSEVPLTDLRQSIAYVPQDAFLFNTSIKENIRYAKLDADDAMIIEAAKAANAHDFIEQLDNGYDTRVGEHGTKLSGGQRQRIAIARAILHEAPILLLDEATSALDSESESLVQEALDRLKKDRTTLIIAHRLSTIQDADTIYVIEAGRIVEAGNHNTLVQQENSLYAKLYHARYQLDQIT